MATANKKNRLQKNIVRKVNSKESLTIAELKRKLEQLEKENQRLEKEIAHLESKGVTPDLKPQMKALHDYNDMKDTTQMVLGYLSDAEHVTVKELHQRYNLPME